MKEDINLIDNFYGSLKLIKFLVVKFQQEVKTERSNFFQSDNGFSKNCQEAARPFYLILN